MKVLHSLEMERQRPKLQLVDEGIIPNEESNAMTAELDFDQMDGKTGKKWGVQRRIVILKPRIKNFWP